MYNYFKSFDMCKYICGIILNYLTYVQIIII